MIKRNKYPNVRLFVFCNTCPFELSIDLLLCVIDNM